MTFLALGVEATFEFLDLAGELQHVIVEAFEAAGEFVRAGAFAVFAVLAMVTLELFSDFVGLASQLAGKVGPANGAQQFRGFAEVVHVTFGFFHRDSARFVFPPVVVMTVATAAMVLGTFLTFAGFMVLPGVVFAFGAATSGFVTFAVGAGLSAFASVMFAFATISGGMLATLGFFPGATKAFLHFLGHGGPLAGDCFFVFSPIAVGFALRLRAPLFHLLQELAFAP